MRCERGVIAGNVTDKYRSQNVVARFLMRRFLATVSQLYARVDPLERVLEIGCGEGDLAAHLRAHRCPPVFVGLDISSQILSLAKQRYPDIHFVAQTATNLPFESQSFDLVIACETLEHLPDPQ